MTFRPGVLVTAGVVSCSALAGACARQGSPPGGPQDRRPPVVVATEPDTFAVVEDGFRGPVRFLFDERVSERPTSGTMDNAVIVSPRTGAVRVSQGRRDVSVSIEGGFKPGLTYRVTLLPVIQDLFNNPMTTPFEIVFSTGAAFTESAVAGLVWDRVTGEPVEDMEVHAIGVDSAIHVARTDTTGIYAFRYLPPQRYRLTAFQDRNRNGTPDPNEFQGSGAVLFGGADTLLYNISALQNDTSAARMVRVDVLDSTTLVMNFDDFLDPARGGASVGVALGLEDGAEAPAEDFELPVVERVFLEPEYLDWFAEVTDSLARADSLAALARSETPPDSSATAPDSSGVDADTATVGPPAPAASATARPPRLEPASGSGGRVTGRRGGTGEGAPRGPDGQPLPGRRVVVRLGSPLAPNVPYRVTASSVTNINGVPLGGGASPVVFQPPEPEEGPAAEEMPAPADSATAPNAVPDTAAGTVSDTVSDTVSVDGNSVDSLSVDTVSVGDSTRVR